MKIKLNKDLPPIVFRIMSQFNHFNDDTHPNPWAKNLRFVSR